MATVGRSNIEITADTRKARRTLGDFFRQAESSGRQFARVLNSLDPLSRIGRDSQTATRNVNSLRDAAKRLDSGLNGLGNGSDLDELNDDLTEAERNMDDLHRQTDEVGDGLNDANRDMRRFGDAAEQESGNAESSFGKLGTAIGGIAVAIAGAFAIDKIKDFATDLAATAGAAQASKAQFTTVFGDMEDVAAERLSAIGSEATILENRMKDSFTKIAAFAKTGGMDTADSLELADRSMRAIADSAAFYDRSLEDTTESLQSFLKGNYENDAALGLSATETTRNSAAMDLYGKKFKDLSEAQKQLTLLQMVEDANKVTGALGQASRESDGWENVIGNMEQAWVDFKAEIGEPVLDIVVVGLKGMTAAVKALDTDKIKNGLASGLKFAGDAFEYAKSKLEPFMTAFSALKKYLSGEETAENILKSYGLDAEEIQAILSPLKVMEEALSKVWQSFKDGKTYVEAVFALFRNQDGTAIGLLHRLGMKPEEIQPIMDAVQRIQDKFGKIGDALIPVKEAIKGVFALIINQDGTAIGIFHKLGLNPDQIQQIMDAVNTVKETFGNLWTGLITLGQTQGKLLAEKWSMITDGAIAVFKYLMPIIQPALAAVLSFAAGIIGKIAAFWKSDGETIIQAVQNIGKIVGVVFAAVFQVIKFIMPAVLAIIKSIWGNIQGVISGALDVIMGLVKVFSGLFTGDFAKMWEGLKQLFMGAVTFLWNFVQLTFFGKILGGAKVFILSFRSFFVSLWQGIVSLFKGNVDTAIITISTAWQTILRTTTGVFKGIWQFLKDIFNSIKSITTGFVNGAKTIFTTGWNIIRNTTATVFNGIWNFLRGLFGIIRTGIQAYFNFYRSIITTGWNAISSVTRTVFNAIWTFLKGIFTTVRSFISSSVSGILTTVRNTWNALKTNTSGAFRDVFNSIKGRFTDIVNAAKALPGRIGDGIGSMASKVTSGVTKVINKLASTLGKGVNGVIGGINWVLGKIGVDEKNYIDKWTVPQYAKGTQDSRNGHPGGPAIVNDGTGSNAGPEMIREPDGSMYMLKGKNVMANFPEGTTVWDARKTKEMLDMIPHYDSGTLNAAGEWIKGKWNAGKKKVKEVGGKVKDAALNVFDYVKNPGKLLDLALKTLGHERPGGSGFIDQMASGGWDKVKKGAVGFVKGKLKDFGLTQSGISLTGGNGGGFGAPFRFTSGPGPRNTGIPGASTFHKGWDWAAPIGTPIPSVTDGVGYRNGWHPLSGNFVEVRDASGKIHRYQHNSKNLVKPGQTVKKGQTVGLVGDTGVGSGAHLHYEVKRGYAKGAIVKAKHLAWVGEKGMEAIIPMMTDRARGIDLWRQVGQHFGFDMDAILNPGQEQLAISGAAVSSVINKVPGANGSPGAAGSSITLNVEVNPAPVYLDGQHLTDILFDHVDSRFVGQAEREDYFKGRTK